MLARFQIAVGGDDHPPTIDDKLIIALDLLVFGVGIVETGTQRRNSLAAVYLFDAGGVSVGIFQHFVNELQLDDFITLEQVGILDGIAAEHVLQFPVVVPGLEVFGVVVVFLGLFE